MHTSTAFTDDERQLLVQVLRRLMPEPEADERMGDDGEWHDPPEMSFEAAYELLHTELHYLGTMEDRARFLAAARWTLSLGSIRRGNWDEAQKFLKLFARLLHAFGWVDEGFASAIERAAGTAGNEDAKLSVLFNAIMSLPFGITRAACRGMADVAARLDASLYGMRRVKQEIGNHLVLMAHADGAPSSQPLLLVGPPGTGKTAVGQAVSAALGLPLHKASLACVVDTMFFRGSSYGWTAAIPGFFAKTLMAAACENPIVLLDEIDKAGGSGHGDIIDTLAEVFDPTQSHHFADLFLGEVPINLSRVLWIATANDPVRVPGYILDRCKIIQVPRYREDERRVIITRFLPAELRKQLCLGFPIVVEDTVGRELAKATESLREAKGALTDLIARELSAKTPGTVQELVLGTWDASVLQRPEPKGPRPIGFQPPGQRQEGGSATQSAAPGNLAAEARQNKRSRECGVCGT
jgi:DNA polymerase III delta prime subunit